MADYTSNEIVDILNVLGDAIEIIAKVQFYIVNGMGIDIAPIIQQFAILNCELAKIV